MSCGSFKIFHTFSRKISSSSRFVYEKLQFACLSPFPPYLQPVRTDLLIVVSECRLVVALIVAEVFLNDAVLLEEASEEPASLEHPAQHRGVGTPVLREGGLALRLRKDQRLISIRDLGQQKLQRATFVRHVAEVEGCVLVVSRHLGRHRVWHPHGRE